MIAELAHRWWRRSPWISSPLIRLSDRIERMAVSVGVTLLLLLIPVAATIGSVTYERKPFMLFLLNNGYLLLSLLAMSAILAVWG